MCLLFYHYEALCLQNGVWYLTSESDCDLEFWTGKHLATAAQQFLKENIIVSRRQNLKEVETFEFMDKCMSEMKASFSSFALWKGFEWKQSYLENNLLTALKANPYTYSRENFVSSQKCLYNCAELRALKAPAACQEEVTKII